MNEGQSLVRTKEVQLGSTGITVPQVFFGTEHINAYTPEFGGRLLVDAALLHGVRFWDTDAEYGSHPQVAAAIKLVERHKVLVCSKTYASTSKDALSDLDRIFLELDPGYLDFCLLHRVPPGGMDKVRPALDELLRAKERSLVRAVGLSTHSPSIVAAAAREPGIEVVCATLNRGGLHLDEGSMEQMVEALRAAHAAGKGTYVIKLLGRGRLTGDVRGAIEWVLKFADCIDGYNIGIASLGELRMNLGIINSYFSNRAVGEAQTNA